MGFEYRLRFTVPVEASTEPVLRQVRGARAAAAGAGFDVGGDAAGWPEASFAADEAGVYFIHYGSQSGRAVLEEVVAALTVAFGRVTVEEL